MRRFDTSTITRRSVLHAGGQAMLLAGSLPLITRGPSAKAARHPAHSPWT